MLSLDSSYWAELDHAYGSAIDTPALLRELYRFPTESSYKNEPWFTLWSSLLHQGDVYPASFAAVPHIVSALAADPRRATMSFFLLPAGIEIARQAREEPVPSGLEPAYSAALARLPALVGAASRPDWDPTACSAALAALAAASGNHLTAQLLVEIEVGEIPGALEWLRNSR